DYIKMEMQMPRSSKPSTTQKHVNPEVNEYKNGENREDQRRQDESVFGSKCREEEVAEVGRDECDDFGGDLNGDQFPPISTQGSNKNEVGNKDCLDNDAGGTGKDYSGCGRDGSVSEGSVSKPMNQSEVGNHSNSKSNDKKESNGGVWNIRFADIVRTNLIDNKLEVISTELGDNGNEVVILNDEMIELGYEKWKNIVCGFFMRGHVTYNSGVYHLRRMWNKYGFIDILKNDGGDFFFKFQDDKGMDEVISNGPWLVNNKPMFVQKWRVAWSVKGIRALANSLGKPIIMDDMTAKMCAKGEGRLSFARVLIEIDAGRELNKEIKVVYVRINVFLT
ncbi:zinc knuckle CX2CX4HX4C containing protein, partial [Tanacetum coccineum]